MVAVACVQPALSQDSPIKIIAVSGPLFDPFFSALKKGADDAASDLGIEYQYTTIQDPSNAQTEITRALDQAVATEPDALIVGNYFPSAMEPIIKRAADAGIPVVVTDGSHETYRDIGAIAFVGFNPPAAGTEAGVKSAELGVKNGICINSVAGNPSLEALCNNYVTAVSEAGGKGKVITLGYEAISNPQQTIQAIKGALEADDTIDGILTLGPAQAELSVQAVEEVGRPISSVKIGTIGLSTRTLEYLRDDKIAMVFDSQPYLDGYYSIIAAYQAVKYRMAPIAPIIVGPRLLTKAEAEEIIEINKTYSGIRGIN